MLKVGDKLKLLRNIFQGGNRMIDNDKYGKALQNKEWFPLLKEENIKKFNELGVERITCFDSLGLSLNEWKLQEKMTMVVMPICDAVNTDGDATKRELRNKGLPVKEKYACVDIDTSEIAFNSPFVTWLKTRNVLLIKANPFLTTDMLAIVLRTLRDIKPKKFTQDEITELILEEQWRTNIGNQLDNVENSMRDVKLEIEANEKNYFTNLKTLKDYKEEKEILNKRKDDIGKFIKTEIRALRQLDFIKNIEISDRISFEIPNVKITDQIQDGTEEKDGVQRARMVNAIVDIGTLKFTIKNGDIDVSNDDSFKEWEHPHAEHGKICFGEARLQSQRLLAGLELVKLAKLLYSWAYSYNKDDAYITLKEWCDRDDEEIDGGDEEIDGGDDEYDGEN